MGQHHRERERGPAALACPHFNVFKFTTANIAGTDFQSPPPVSTYFLHFTPLWKKNSLVCFHTLENLWKQKKQQQQDVLQGFSYFLPSYSAPVTNRFRPPTHNWSNTSSLKYKTLFYIHCIFLFEKAAARSQFVFLFKITFGCKSEMSLSTQEGEKEQQIVHVQKVTNNKNPLCRVVSITCVRVNTSL